MRHAGLRLSSCKSLTLGHVAMTTVGGRVQLEDPSDLKMDSTEHSREAG